MNSSSRHVGYVSASTRLKCHLLFSCNSLVARERCQTVPSVCESEWCCCRTRLYPFCFSHSSHRGCLLLLQAESTERRRIKGRSHALKASSASNFGRSKKIQHVITHNNDDSTRWLCSASSRDDGFDGNNAMCSCSSMGQQPAQQQQQRHLVVHDKSSNHEF
jgi:hypothetical protein